jgi:hypothetical protein
MKTGRPATGRRTKSPGLGISDSWPTYSHDLAKIRSIRPVDVR